MPRKPQKTPNKHQMRNIIKRQITSEEYNSLIQFVFMDKPFKSEIPGTYSIYYMLDYGMIIATNAACINEWLVEHDMPTRAPISDWTINAKQKHYNAVDNRTETSVTLKNEKGKVGRPKSEDTGTIHLDVWQWYTAGVKCSEIARRISCTPANVHYYIRKYKKHNPNWEDELEVDN